ncbi:hypothetical protein ABZX75_16480 [Streptomyces sp. NPDC003038]|uniref:hypothetical protein n=1 Tax=unclassified Streptomyces TaxID=2593676 RepID=UPI0033B397F3
MASTLFALALLAALAGPIGRRLYRRPGFITGRDGRLSTSITLALAWTVILLWLLLTILVYGLTAGGGVDWFQGEHGPLSTLTTVYLPLLGGPYVALIAAKTVVGMRVESGGMAKPAPKPTASGRRPLRELIANDSGRTDLIDLQYVALSAVTMLYVVLFFLADVGGGLPRLPAEMWALTGAPAGAYLINKMATRATPVITDVTHEAGLLTVAGGGFAPDPAGRPAQLSVDGAVLPAALDPVTGALTAPLPAATEPPFTVVATARGLRSDPYRYAPTAAVASATPIAPAPLPEAAPAAPVAAVPVAPTASLAPVAPTPLAPAAPAVPIAPTASAAAAAPVAAVPVAPAVSIAPAAPIALPAQQQTGGLDTDEAVSP